MNNSKYHKVSIQHIRIIARWMTVVLFGLFFLMALINNINQSFVLNDVDIFLITLVIIYLIGILVSYRQEILAGYIMSFSSAAYVIVQEFSISSWFFEVDGFYLLIPGVFFMVIGYLQSEINLHKMMVERLKKEVSELNQSYRLTKSMLDIVPDMIRNDDLDFILQKVLEKAIESIPKAHAGSIILKLDDRMEFRAAVGYNLDLLKKLDLRFEDILQYKLGIIHDPVIINDVETYNAKNVYKHTTFDILEENQIVSKAMMTHVIMYKHEIFGFINIDNLEDPKAFSTKDKNVIKHVTKHIESILENQSLIENVYKMSRYDALTGAYTRRYYQVQLKHLYEESVKKSQSFSIITFDLDDLKEKNDVHGHQAGDLYLLSFANLIRDITPKKDFLSRVGGDEFVLVIPNSNHELALETVHLIETRCIENPFTFENIKLFYKFSYGISSFPNDTENLESLVKLSDERMYVNKRKKGIQ